MLRDSNESASARYEMLAPLGSGGFGAVYEARDARTGQRVAIKELEHTSGAGISRFKHEFRALADCHHPNLVGLRELIEQRGRWLIVMELVPGTDLLSYVAERDASGAHHFHEGRLRGALLGMVTGLRALHGYGILHRDLKPSNVRVTPEGRAVLLDFGLVTSIEPTEQSTDALGLGTVAYMAPEQAQGRQLGPEADVYALGVCLFEALTGQLPFDGEHAMDILMRKQRDEAPRASSLAPGAPDDLDALCSQMLALDPAARPDLRAVHAALTGTHPGPTEPMQAAGRAVEALFSGREAELQNLARALAQTEDGALRVVLVEGESGVGKSELSAEFVRRAQRDHPTLLTLRGRCYENEQVSYKAFDGCIDELAKQLSRLSVQECDALLPLRSALLAQLFPVLRNVRSIARAPREGYSADPTARRLEAFAALAALLARLAVERPMILIVDDLQWADAESFRLLQALFEAPEVPPLLLLATVRPRAELEPDVLAHVQALRQRAGTSVIEVLGLPEGQARALAQKLLGREVPEAWLMTIASESEGHPLFLSELVQYAEAHPAAAHGPIRLEDALRARIERTEPTARALLELVALAARPHGSHVFTHALGGDPREAEDAARSLLSARFLRMRKGQQLGCFHDRIRHAVVELIPRARLAALHRRLAEALAASADSDASELARHWDLAGERERAADAYERAADASLEALAFTRAAQLYGRALELLEELPGARRQRLMVQRAHALAGSGASGEAAALYQHAADRAHGDARIELRNRAAQHLVLSSQIVTGVAAARALLSELGFVLPRSTVLALLRFGWDALWVALSRTRRRRPEALGPADPHMNVAHELGFVTAIVDMRTYLPLNMQAVRRSLRGDTRLDAARAAAWRGWMRALQGSLPEALPLLEHARGLIGADSGAVHRATLWFVEGSAFMAGYDFAESSRRLQEAHRLLEEQCPDQSWLLVTVRYHLGSTWYYTGKHAQLAAQVTRWLATARERNDVMSVALIAGMGYGFVRHLMVDAPQKAARELDDALAQLPAEPYSFPHLGRFIGMTITLLYEGGRRALEFLDAHDREHGRSFLMRAGSVKQARAMLRCLALLSAIAATSGAERAALLAAARELVRKLRRRSSYEQAFVETVSAQLAVVAGDRSRALGHARTARALHERAQHGNERPLRYLEGLLEGGERGRMACEVALAELRAEGWREPLRALRLTLPLHDQVTRDDAPVALAPSTLLRGRYEVQGTLDPRGVGSVFRARDVHTGRSVALKELTHRGSASLERFKQEFRALSEVQSEHLVQLESMFSHEGVWYICMELVEGQDLLRYVRPAGGLEPARMRLAMAGLVEALIALHDAGFVHRDVRPEKVRVTAEGRVVLLDFGHIARIGDARAAASAGDPEHAAPEQLAGSTPHPSADVYALGDLLYRALTGRPPHEGASRAELLARKQGAPPPPECEGLPALAAHCQLMLSPVASARPALAALRSALRADRARATLELEVLRAPEPVQKVVFTGRARELSALDEWLERTTDDGLTLVLIEGASGLGKSCLAGAFAERMVARSPHVRALRSRCYESEQLAHRAFDGAVDQLAKLLAELPPPAMEALLPKRAALLAQLFPVLASVPAIAQASKKGLPADPTLRQLGARACFVQLLSKLTRELELLFVVDDLQWADDDSFRMLDALLAEARTLPLLIVATVRASSAAHDEPRAQALAALRAHPQTRVLPLAGLCDEDAAALVDALAEPPLSHARRAQVVRESKGHPVFLRELLEQERRGDAHALTLEAALGARIAHFEPDARELLALAALAARPLPRHVLARALGVRELSPRAVLALLGSGYLQRDGADALVCERDRIRALAESQLSPEARRAFAEALARALEIEPRSEPAERARLWEQAGEGERAVQAYEQAGDRALAGLGFGLAAEHYARALGLIGAQHDERWRRITIQRGHALARSGDFEGAAGAFEAAAAGAPDELSVRLRVWAAQHSMQSARVDRGLAAAAALLAQLGEPLPQSDRAALARIGWEDLRLSMRGLSLRPRRAPPPPAELLRFEAMRAFLPLLNALAPLAGLALTLRYLRAALDAGEPELSARALSLGAMWRTIRAPRRDDGALFAQARKLADEVGDPLLIALVELDWGVASMQNRVAAAPAHFATAHELLQTRCPGEPWALDNARSFLGAAWGYTGDFNAIARALGGWTDEARARGDKYGLASLAGFGSGATRHLLAGRPDEARAELAEAMAPWANAAFSHIHFGAFVQEAGTRTVSGDRDMLAWLDRAETALRAPLLMRMPTCRLQHEHAQLNALFLTLDGRTAPGLRPVLARARKVVAAVAKNTAEPAPGLALLGSAVVDALAGHPVRALASAQAAHAKLRALRHYMAPGAHYLEGFLEGGEAGRLKSEIALREVNAQGWQDPRRGLALTLPGAHLFG